MHAPNSNERYLKKILQFGNSIRVSIVQPSGHIITHRVVDLEVVQLTTSEL